MEFSALPTILTSLRFAIQELPESIAEIIAEDIKSRTEAGVDIDDRAFDEYSSIYTSFLRSKGQPTAPDLTLTGQLLNAIAVRSLSAESAEVYIESSQIAKATVVSEKREFFGISTETEAKIDRFIKAQLEDRSYGN